MTFSSPIFLFMFLPVFLVVYFAFFAPVLLTRHPKVRSVFTGLGNAVILLSSLVFYFWGESWLVVVMLSSTTIDFLAGLGIGRHGATRGGRAWLTVSVTANLLLLGYFKYVGFGIENLNAGLAAAGLGGPLLQDFVAVALPLGISFYTFQSMSYTIDVYRGEVAPTRNFLGFACFVTMFPQLVAGPIVRYRDIAAEIRERTVTRDGFSYGVLRFVTGLGKKVLVANVVAVPADRIFGLPPDQVTTSLAWLGVASYTLQIYFDFSGYSDMAVGLGRMLGFTFPENFRYPYAARSIQDFWRRWHISLSTWFRDYLYIPLGGGRAGPLKTYVNLIIVFFLCGLWHGASWSFVIWGLFHGSFLVFERLGLAVRIRRLPRGLPHLYVMLVVMSGWVLFRADDLPRAIVFYRAMAGFGADSGADGAALATHVDRQVLLALAWGAVFSAPVLPWLMRGRDRVRHAGGRGVRLAFELVYGGIKAALVLGIFAGAVLALAGGSYNPFIYFRF